MSSLCEDEKQAKNTNVHDDAIDNIAKEWRELSGENDWKGLLDPPRVDLRHYVIHYGEMAQATYDAFNGTNISKFAGSCRYARKNLLEKVGLTHQANRLNKYEVTKFLYATSSIPLPESFLVKSLSREAWSRESNWMGFVAVATDEGKAVLGRRDIVVAWRGTVHKLDWIHNLALRLVPGTIIFGGDSLYDPKVHEGWYSIYTTDDPRSRYNKTSAREQALSEVARLVEKYKNEEVSVTVSGHSLGAALSTLNSVDIVVNGINKPIDMPDKVIPVTAFGFASPHVGDYNFHRIFNSLDHLHALHIRNSLDIVPDYPLIGYSDVGVEFPVDLSLSPYLLTPGNLVSWHSMESYMHGVAGTQGAKNRGFKLEVPRDISLVNKHLDGLKREHGVPQSWWCEKNAGMVQQDDGYWKLIDHEEDGTT